jgi:hypothetical protein
LHADRSDTNLAAAQIEVVDLRVGCDVKQHVEVVLRALDDVGQLDGFTTAAAALELLPHADCHCCPLPHGNPLPAHLADQP